MNVEAHHKVAGKVIFDLSRPDTRDKAWYAFGVIKDLAAKGSPFMINVRQAIATIARKLMGKRSDIGYAISVPLPSSRSRDLD